jgi:hypothetical protein
LEVGVVLGTSFYKRKRQNDNSNQVGKGTDFPDQKTKVIRRVDAKKYPPKARTTLYTTVHVRFQQALFMQGHVLGPRQPSTYASVNPN